MKNGGRIPWNVTAIFEMIETSWKMVTRRYRHVSGELVSTQYWNLFLIPPLLCKNLSHVRIDRCEDDIVLDRTIDARSSNFTAPSSSRFAESSCRTNLIINFETSRKCWSKVTGSTSILSFFVRNRHRRQCWIWCLLLCCLRDRFPCTPLSNTFNVSLFRHLRYVLVDSVHDPDPRASLVAK